MRKSKIIYTIIVTLLLLSCGSDLSYQDQIKNYNYLVNKADSLISVENYNEAYQYANSAIEITDTLPNAFFAKGTAFYRQNRFEKAEENFDEVIDIEGDKSRAYKSRALVYLKMKDSDFLDDIDTYLESYPDDEGAHELRRDYFEAENDFDKAIEEYNITIKTHKDSVELYIRRSEMYLKNKDYDETLDDYNMVLSMRPDSPDIKSKKTLLEKKLNSNKNKNIFIGILIIGYIVYLLLSFLVLKPLVLKKAATQIGGEYNVSRDPLVWILPILLLMVFIALRTFDLIPNF